MRARIVLEVEHFLPDFHSERIQLYGTSDLVKCVEIDLQNDAPAFFEEAKVKVVSVVDVDVVDLDAKKKVPGIEPAPTTDPEWIANMYMI